MPDTIVSLGSTEQITALADGSPAEALRVLARLVARPEVPLSLRRHAVRAIGTLSPRVDPDAVIDALAAVALDGPVELAVPATTAIGRRGGARELGLLLDLARHPEPVVAAHARFAGALVEHRHCPDEPGEFPLVSPRHVELRRATSRATPASVDPPDRADANAARSVLGAAVPILAGSRRLVAVQCGGRRHVLACSPEVDPALERPTAFTERAWYVGHTTVRHPGTGRHLVAAAVLTRPAGGDAVDIGLYRDDGALVYGGTGHVVGGRLDAALGAGIRPGVVPATVRVGVADGELSLAVDADVRRPGRVTRRGR